LKRTSRRISILASTLLALTLLTVAGRAQDNTSGPPRSAAQVRAFLSNGTLTPAELRQRLKDAGQTDDEIDAAMASYARRNPRANDATRTADAARPADAARASDAAPKPDTTVARRVPASGPYTSASSVASTGGPGGTSTTLITAPCGSASAFNFSSRWSRGLSSKSL